MSRYQGFTLDFKPLDHFPRKFTKDRRWGAGAFKVGWLDTLDKLHKELNMLEANRVIVKLAVSESEIRVNGMALPRSTAKPEHPGVVLLFTCKYGTLSYACDLFEDWKANVRAIALTLERLRMAEMYGATSKGEQYSGFKALPAPGDRNGFLNPDDAAEWLVGQSFAKRHISGSQVLKDEILFKDLYREVAKKLHPDSGGSTEEFKKLQEAKSVIEKTWENLDAKS